MSNFKQSHIKVVIGSKSLITPLTGIGNYTLNLAKTLSENPLIEIEGFYGYKWSKQMLPISAPKTSKLKKIVRQFIPYSYTARKKTSQIAFNSGLKKNSLIFITSQAFYRLNLKAQPSLQCMTFHISVSPTFTL